MDEPWGKRTNLKRQRDFLGNSNGEQGFVRRLIWEIQGRCSTESV